ncbi:UNVERIFIED_CONTAM: hypothetical protein H355_015974 [Colinus virginianus]|nr:hypothetical protein H355_015974 [Colinus virginianus]
MAGADGWRPPRPCEDYWWEWKHCRGLRHAFHHYYAHGELPACGRWRDDYAACRAWDTERAAAARVPPGGGGWGGPVRSRGRPAAVSVSVLQEALLESERARVLEQKKRGAVWALRSSPPPEWHRPLQRGSAEQ